MNENKIGSGKAVHIDLIWNFLYLSMECDRSCTYSVYICMTNDWPRKMLNTNSLLYICLQDRRIISFSVVNITEKLQ